FFQISDDIKIEMAVAIDVGERGAGAPLRHGRPRRGGCVAERAVAIVAPQRIRSEGRDVKIVETIRVVVPDGASGRVAELREARCGSDAIELHCTTIAEQLAGRSPVVGYKR